MGINVTNKEAERILIVGGGFGGVSAAKELKDLPVEVGVIDRRNYHLFQPLLYQVATAALNPSDIASPIRRIFRHQKNVGVFLGEVDQVDLSGQCIRIDGESVPFDYLVLAAGATHSYFGNDQWAKYAPGLKTIDDATEIRRRFLLAFEAAEVETDPEARSACLTFIVVGAGPTGCELAGAMAEIAHNIIPADFRHIDTTTARVILIEGGPRVLGAMSEKCSKAAHEQLESLGVEIMLNTSVTEIQEDGVRCGETFVAAQNVLWAAGVKASPLGESLGVELDRSGRVIVNPDLSIPEHPNVFVIGDQAAAKCAKTGKPIPGVAQGAMQGGAFVGKIIRKEFEAKQRSESSPKRNAFTYFDKGNLATIGRNKAVADAFGVKLKGLPAWIIWAAVHILFLVNFRSKVAVAISWCWTYLFSDRGARLITGKSKIAIKRPPKFE
ncbi:NAD(P)/FAD-dependent oxidoreductase [Rubellicoccus peritrichatus]|uniref:NADH:ubiquinone reductase (non-electrogenic) n=1 Tax=Rubellicoccus peritrichatus TaxID=3080537 RepID=A0AAQ3QRK4_9BACT|nr:NAD(P)/FAD-dependent oxidoreductase [Puniceicoccus sp. CR14]WOO39421.1 NAD(P)/FAD-dependent oxidoreductase [Puniceicoccus sp. CR14]